MTFQDVLAQAIDWLQRDKRITYRALKRQFDLDDEYLEDLKGQLLFSHPVVDEDGQGLVWIGKPTSTPKVDARHRTDAESRFHAMLSAVMWWLQRDRRITYRTLKHLFGIDDTLLEDIRQELRFRRLAVDEEGGVLVWIGETTSSAQPATSVTDLSDGAASAATISPALPVPQLQIPATDTTINGPPSSPEGAPIEPASAEQPTASQPVRSAPKAERRHLTVMFCDLADSTQLSQALDPEDLREVIRAYQHTSAEVIQRFDGYIAQHLGDGLLVYFGWPRAHEDDAQRALYAGLGIVEAVTTTLNPRLEQEKGVQLTIRLGVHTGPVVVGEMGGGNRPESLATGETVNIAARLEGLAQSNTVVVSRVTERLVRGGFALAAMGPQVLKGVAEPMQVFQVLSPTEVHRDDDESLPDGGMFLVGRDEEIGLLLRRWEQSKEGLGQVVLISGEAGIGKSSLVEGLRRHVREEGMTCIAFRCSPYHTNSAFYPIIAHVQRALGWQSDDTVDTKLSKLEQALARTTMGRDEAVPLLAGLLALPLPEDRYPPLAMSPQQQRHQTQDVLVAWLLEEAERQPVLAVWEDLHWADPSTLEFLSLVIDQTPTVPMLHVLTFRPEFIPPWPHRSHMTPLTLNRLERPQVEAFIIRLARGKALPSGVVEHIVGKTDGVPLYVEELTKMLLASDLLREGTDQYVLTGPLVTMAIPDTLQDSLMARLDQMNTAKEVAQLGSVLGREFAYEFLQAIAAQDEHTLQAGLSRLVEAELLYQRGRPPRARYMFKHALIQAAAYASLLKSARQQVHQQIARLLETRFPEVVETQPELVAHHYTEAGQTTDAIRYWQQAGRHANERSSQDEAIAHLTKGLDLLRRLPEAPARLEQELQLSVALGSSLMAAKGYAAPEVEDVYTRARDLCQQLSHTPLLFNVLSGMVAFYNSRGAQPAARELAEQALALAEREQRPIRLVWAYSGMGAVLFCQGELVRARQHLERSMALYSPRMHRAHLPIQDPGVTCLGYAACTLGLLGYADQALVRAEMANDLARELAHPYSVVLARALTTRVYQLRGDIQTTAEQANAMLALATEQGFHMLAAHAMILRGWTWAMRGQVEKGLGHMRQGFAAYQATGAGFDQPFYLALLAEMYAQARQVEAGLRVATEALALVEQHGERYYEADLHRLKGELLLKQSSDHTAEAETRFQQALGIARHQHAKALELRAATSLARLWQSQGKRQEAYDLLAPVYGWFTEGFDTADLIDAKALLDELS